jgi:hypothetical protein
LLTLDRIKAAINASLAAVVVRSRPDSKDLKADAVLNQEAASADLVQSRADSVRADTWLRRIIVYFLCVLIALVVLVTILQILRNQTLSFSTSVAPGGILTALVGGLVWMLRRP